MIESFLTQGNQAFIVLAFVFMFIDIISGNVKGFVTKKWNSSNGWDGIKKKTALVLFIILGIACHVGQIFVDLGINIPVLDGICGYIIFVEILSSVENICEINPNLKTSKLLSFFDFARNGVEDDEEVGSHAA